MTPKKKSPSPKQRPTRQFQQTNQKKFEIYNENAKLRRTRVISRTRNEWIKIWKKNPKSRHLLYKKDIAFARRARILSKLDNRDKKRLNTLKINQHLIDKALKIAKYSALTLGQLLFGDPACNTIIIYNPHNNKPKHLVRGGNKEYYEKGKKQRYANRYRFFGGEIIIPGGEEFNILSKDLKQVDKIIKKGESQSLFIDTKKSKTTVKSNNLKVSAKVTPKAKTGLQKKIRTTTRDQKAAATVQKEVKPISAFKKNKPKKTIAVKASTPASKPVKNPASKPAIIPIPKLDQQYENKMPGFLKTYKYVKDSLGFKLSTKDFDNVIYRIAGALRMGTKNLFEFIIGSDFKKFNTKVFKNYPNTKKDVNLLVSLIKIMEKRASQFLFLKNYSDFSRFASEKYKLDPINDFFYIKSLYSDPKDVETLRDSLFEKKFKLMKKYFPGLQLETSVISELNKFLSNNLKKAEIKLKKLQSFAKQLYSKFGYKTVNRFFVLKSLTKLLPLKNTILEDQSVKLFQYLKKAYKIKLSYINMYNRWDIEAWAKVYKVMKPLGNPIALMKKIQPYVKGLKSDDLLNPGGNHNWPFSIDIPYIVRRISEHSFHAKWKFLEKYKLKINASHYDSDMSKLVELMHLPLWPQDAEKYMQFAKKNNVKIANLEVLINYMKIPLAKLNKYKETKSYLEKLFKRKHTSDEIIDALKTNLLQTISPYFKAIERMIKEGIKINGFSDFQRYFLGRGVDLRLLKDNSFWGKYNKFAKIYNVKKTLYCIKAFNEISASERNLLLSKKAISLWNPILKKITPSIIKNYSLAIRIVEMMIKLIHLKKPKVFLDNLFLKVYTITNDFTVDDFLVPLSNQKVVKALQNSQIVEKIQQYVKKGYVKISDGYGIERVINFVSIPQAGEIFDPLRKMGVGRALYSRELVILGRLVRIPNFIKTIKEKEFQDLFKRLVQKYSIRISYTELEHIAKLYNSLPQKGNKRETSFIFSKRFSSILEMIGKDFNMLNVTPDLLLSVYKLSKKIDFKKVQQIRAFLKSIKEPSSANDLFLINLIANKPHLMKLLKNPKKLLEEVKDIYKKPGVKRKIHGRKMPTDYTERPELNSARRLALIRMLLLKRSLNNPAFKKRLGKLIAADIKNKKTEMGGYLHAADQRLKIRSVTSVSESNESYGNTISKFLLGGIMTFHFHALREKMKGYEGPSGHPQGRSGDLVYAREYQITDTVITTMGRTKDGKHLRVNVDMYYVDKTKRPPKAVVIDMGVYEVPYTP